MAISLGEMLNQHLQASSARQVSPGEVAEQPLAGGNMQAMLRDAAAESQMNKARNLVKNLEKSEADRYRDVLFGATGIPQSNPASKLGTDLLAMWTTKKYTAPMLAAMKADIISNPNFKAPGTAPQRYNKHDPSNSWEDPGNVAIRKQNNAILKSELRKAFKYLQFKGFAVGDNGRVLGRSTGYNDGEEAVQNLARAEEDAAIKIPLT
jgi:hypothetical protein